MFGDNIHDSGMSCINNYYFHYMFFCILFVYFFNKISFADKKEEEEQADVSTDDSVTHIDNEDSVALLPQARSQQNTTVMVKKSLLLAM